jgi:predicted transcriptional regulator
LDPGKCSYCAKILVVLTKAKTELFIGQLVRETGFTRRTVFRHLKKLVESGIVKEFHYGRTYAYQIDPFKAEGMTRW